MADSKPGLGSDNMSQRDKDRIHKMGGEASNSGSTSRSSATSHSSATGAAGKTEAAKRGGQHSHRGSASS